MTSEEPGPLGQPRILAAMGIFFLFPRPLRLVLRHSERLLMIPPFVVASSFASLAVFVGFLFFLLSKLAESTKEKRE